jgi:hypothetical protein
LILIATVVLTPPLGVLVLNIFFMLRFMNSTSSFNVLWPFEYLYKNFFKILKNLFTKSISIVIIIMLAFSLFFHVLELNRLNKIASGQKINNPDIDFSVGFITQFWNDLIYGEDAGFGEDKSGYCMEIAFNGNRIVKPVAASVYGFTYAYLMYFIEKYEFIT